MYINFLLMEMTYLRYFMPLVIEAKKRNIKLRMFIKKHSKYTNPYAYKEVLNELGVEYDIKIYDADEISKFPAEVTFLLEGSGIEYLKYVKYQTLKVVLVAGCDFVQIYKNYIDRVDYVIFISKFIAEHYGKICNKNLYLGSPKYDVILNKEVIFKKYGLGESKIALVISPKTKDLEKIDLKSIYKSLLDLKYEVVVKTRGKDAIPALFKNAKKFKDFSWFPHSTMELIEVSDVIINFDSAACKECVMLRSPFINFRVKTELNRFADNKIPFDFLYNYEYCVVFKNGFDAKSFNSAINKIDNDNFDDEFEKAIHNHLYDGMDSSKRILDMIIDKIGVKK